MIWVDYCIVVIFLLSVLIGLWRGLTREVFSLLTWLLAVGLAVLAADALIDWAWLREHITDPSLRRAAVMAGLFLCGLLLGALITHFAVQAIRDSRFSPADRTLGAGIGLVRAVAVVTVLVFVAGHMGARDDRWWRESLLVDAFKPLASSLESIVPASWLRQLEPASSTQQTPSLPSS